MNSKIKLMFERFNLKNNTFARNSIILFIGTMIANLLSYFFHLSIGRMVSVEVYGEAESLISLIAIISVPATTIGLIATKYAAICKAENDKQGSYKIMRYLYEKTFIYGFPIFLATLFLIPAVNSFLNIKNIFPLAIVWILMFLSFFSTINSGVLSGWQKFKDISLMSILGIFVKLIAGIALVKLGFLLNGIIISFALGWLASYIASIFMLKNIREKRNKIEADTESKINLVAIRNYILPVFVSSLGITILGNIDMVLVKHNLSAVAAGQYGALAQVGKIIFFATGVIASVLFAMAAENNHKKGNSIRIFINAFLFTAFISLGVIIIYFLFPRVVLNLFFGKKYLNVSFYLGWFAIALSLFSFANLILQYLLSIHKVEIAYIFLLISLIATVLILIWGKTIFAILTIISIVNLSCVLIGGAFLYYNYKRSKITEIIPEIFPFP